MRPPHLALVLLAAFQAQASKPAMQQAFQSLINLQPFAVSTERFSDPKNRDLIRRDLEVLSRIEHLLPSPSSVNEPGLTAVLGVFKDYLKDMNDKFQRGNYEYARHRVRTVAGFCLSCHSRLPDESGFADASRRVERLNLPAFQRAEFLAATRQFDAALESFQKALATTPKTELDIIEFGRALRHSLTILVRVKQDAEGTFALVDRLARRKELPEFLQRLLGEWKKDAHFWLGDRVVAKDLTPDALLRKARSLTEHAATLRSFPSDENADISYLRASSYLHEALSRDPKGSFRSEALYLLGICYESLQEPFLWDLDLIYFEMCIREFPRTDFAKKCYRRYSQKVFAGYTGSTGTYVPESDLKKLGDLRRLSQ